MKIVVFPFKLQWNMFLGVQITINQPSLVQVMAWRHTGDKAIPEPMMASLVTHICVTRPQWVNSLAPRCGNDVENAISEHTLRINFLGTRVNTFDMVMAWCRCETIFWPPYILTPGSIYRTIFWPRGQYIVTIFWPPSRYFDPPSQ